MTGMQRAKMLVTAVIISCLLSLGSVGAVVGESMYEGHARCVAKQDQNARTTKFLTQLLADPKTPDAVKTRVLALTAEDFPQQRC